MFNYDNYPTRKIYDGTQSVIRFGELELSVVRHSGSYGGNQGLYEIAVFNDVDQVELPGVTNEHDSVKGYLTKEDVDGILTKMYFVTGCEPVADV